MNGWEILKKRDAPVLRNQAHPDCISRDYIMQSDGHAQIIQRRCRKPCRQAAHSPRILRGVPLRRGRG